jgi:hypothetical protein
MKEIRAVRGLVIGLPISLVLWLVALILLTVAPAHAQQTIKADAQWSSEGPYLAYASPWGAGALVAGRDYGDTLSWPAGSLPTNLQISWRWPAASGSTVRSYDFAAYGNYDGGAVMKPVAPVQVRAMNALTLAYGVDWAADPTAFNGLAEFFLTKTAGNGADKAIEIGTFWHAPPATRAWLKTGKQLGTFTDRFGKGWTVVLSTGGVAGTYVTFTPLTFDQSWGTIDMKGQIDFLRSKGIVDPSWWWNGCAFGTEVLGGIGSAVVRQFTVAR